MDDLECTRRDYEKAQGFSGLKDLNRSTGLASEYEIIDGGMRLNHINNIIRSNTTLDTFVEGEFQKFSEPRTRQFGENIFTVVGNFPIYRVGHLERYCGSTFRMATATLKAKSGGKIAAVAHSHPFFRGPNASADNRIVSVFGPGDWVSLAAFECPVYLYTPYRKIFVMEYLNDFVTIRPLGGGPAKWRVSH